MHGAQQCADLAAVGEAELTRHLAAIGASDRVDNVGAAQEAADRA
jgi:hypothetical protein